MNLIFEKTFYSLLFFTLFKQIEAFLVYPSNPPDYVMFAYPLNFLISQNSLSFLNLFHIIFYLLSLSLLLSAIASNKKILKCFAVFCFLITFSIHYSYGKISHSHHVWLISSFLMLFFSSKSLLNSKQNIFLIRLIQSLTLSHYFISGVWKLKSIFNSKYSLESLALEQVAYGLLEKGLNNHFLLDFFGLYYGSKILGYGFFLIVVFQFSCIIPILLNRYFLLYGFLSILFHTSTAIVLFIKFKSTVLACLFFLILTELMLKYEEKPT